MIISRLNETLRREGILPTIKKIFVATPRIIGKSVAHLLFDVNSKGYWNFRMRHNWVKAGGPEQTVDFCVSAFANTNLKNVCNPYSILDFGCASGDSTPIFKCFFPSTKIFLHDLSPVGIEMAISKYAQFQTEKWDGKTRCELVYCSNVIEHVSDPDALIDELINASSRFLLIQCPWNERHKNGDLITDQKPLNEHIQTIDDNFIERFFNYRNFRSIEVFKGRAPLAWPQGEQVYLLIEK